MTHIIRDYEACQQETAKQSGGVIVLPLKPEVELGVPVGVQPMSLDVG